MLIRAVIVTSSFGNIILLDTNSLIPSIDQVDDTKALLDMFLAFIETIVSSFPVLIVTPSRSIGLSGIKVAGSMDVIFTVEDGS